MEIIEPETTPPCLPIEQTGPVKRKRAENWRDEEKLELLELIKPSVDVIENKTKLLSVNQNKEDHWNRIYDEFLAKGYNRPISRLKEQWRRMKLQSRRNIELSTGETRPVSGIDGVVNGMMAHLEVAVVKKDEPEEKPYEKPDEKPAERPEEKPENCPANDFVEDQSKLITAFLKQSVKIEGVPPQDTEAILVENEEASGSGKNGVIRRQSGSGPGDGAAKNAASRRCKPAKRPMQEDELFRLNKQRVTEEMRHNEELHKLRMSNAEKEHSMRLSMQKKLYEAKLKLIFHNYAK